jgi:hypothetical protein
MNTPEAAYGRLPLKGEPPAARQSRFRGGSREGTQSI